MIFWRMSLLAVEINGFQDYQNDVLLLVLNSKRLLIDHVEILEECFEQIRQSDRKSNFTASKLAIFGSIPVATFFLSPKFNTKWTYPLSTLFAAYGTCYGIKWINKRRFRRQWKQLEHFIRALEQFELAVKKNLLFLNESQHLRATQAALERSGLGVESVASNCARCCIAAIETIHSAVQRLERDWALTERWNSLYAPIESLEDCELFSESVVENVSDAKAVKDYYNVFAYMQSQFLTRLALSVTCGMPDLNRCNLPELSAKLDDQKAFCLSQLNMILDTNRERAPRVVSKSLPPELSHLRTLSMSLSAKLYSTVHRYNGIERVLEEINSGSKEDKSKLQDVELPLEDIINDLNASTEECQRLLITLKKLLNKDDDHVPLEIDPRFKENLEQALDLVPSEERVFSEQTKPCIRDEFFAVDGTDQDWMDEEDRRRSLAQIDDLESINSKIAKRHFKPVLVQLRERIEPIGVEFKEREKRALKDKGIDVVDSDREAASSDEEEGSLDDVPVRRTVYSSDSEDERELDERNAIKFQRSVQRYDDVRGFLATKEQMNIFGLKPMASVVNEDVLE